MKNLIILFAMMLSFGAMAQVKIGFVDTQKLLDTMPSRKVANEKYMAFEKELIEEVRAMDAELQKMAAEHERTKGDKTVVLIQASEKRIMEKQRQLEERYEGVQGELQAYSSELNAPILDRIQKAIKIVSERQKISMVVDKASTLFHAVDMDITKLVATELMILEKEVK